MGKITYDSHTGGIYTKETTEYESLTYGVLLPFEGKVKRIVGTQQAP